MRNQNLVDSSSPDQSHYLHWRREESNGGFSPNLTPLYSVWMGIGEIEREEGRKKGRGGEEE